MKNEPRYSKNKGFWGSLSQEERTAHFKTHYRLIREKKLSDPDKFMKDEDAVREILNLDLPRAEEEAIQEAIRNGRPNIDKDLHKHRIGVGTFEIKNPSRNDSWVCLII
jgi:hypothetical protein